MINNRGGRKWAPRGAGRNETQWRNVLHGNSTSSPPNILDGITSLTPRPLDHLISLGKVCNPRFSTTIATLEPPMQSPKHPLHRLPTTHSYTATSTTSTKTAFPPNSLTAPQIEHTKKGMYGLLRPLPINSKQCGGERGPLGSGWGGFTALKPMFESFSV